MESVSLDSQPLRHTLAQSRAASTVFTGASVQGRDVDEDRCLDAREDVYRHAMLADCLDRLLEDHLVPVHLDPFLCKQVGDLPVGHRTEEAILLAGLDAYLEADGP